MPDWVGSILFVCAVGLSGAKLNEDFGPRGLAAIGMLVVLIAAYAAAVSMAFA